MTSKLPHFSNSHIGRTQTALGFLVPARLGTVQMFHYWSLLPSHCPGLENVTPNTKARVCSISFFSVEVKNDREGENKEGRRKPWNILRVLNLCVLFSNPVALDLLWSFKMWLFLNPPRNFSFHFTLPDPPHSLSPAPSSPLSSVVFLRIDGRDNAGGCVLGTGKWETEEAMVGIWPCPLLFLCCLPPVIRGRQADSHQTSVFERSRRTTHFHLFYWDGSLVGELCLILPPSLRIFPGVLHGLVCQPSCNSHLSGHQQKSLFFSLLFFGKLYLRVSLDTY